MRRWILPPVHKELSVRAALTLREVWRGRGAARDDGVSKREPNAKTKSNIVVIWLTLFNIKKQKIYMVDLFSLELAQWDICPYFFL